MNNVYPGAKGPGYMLTKKEIEMRKIDFYKPIMTLKGEEMKSNENGVIKVAYINDILANMLIVAKAEESAARQLKLATTIYDAKGPIDIEDADLKIIKVVVKKAGASAIVEGHIERLLEVEDIEK